MNVSRAMSQAVSHTKKWVGNLPGNKQADVPGEPKEVKKSKKDKKKKAEKKEKCDEYTYGFYLEVLKPYRTRSGTSHKEVGEVCDDKSDDRVPFTCVLARWLDGTVAGISAITYEEYYDKLTARRQIQTELWKDTHVTSKHKLQLKTKRDRHELIILCEQEKQILQVRCDSWDALT